MTRARILLSVCAALYFGGLIALTFTPGSSELRDQWVWPVIAFVPVGVVLVLLMGRRRWWVALGFAVLGGAWIEAAQTIWMPEGYGEVGDVFWSGVGATLGVVIAVIVTNPRRRPDGTHDAPSIVSQASTREIPQD
jgi:glycopeptide antibiotics resistance protein